MSNLEFYYTFSGIITPVALTAVIVAWFNRQLASDLSRILGDRSVYLGALSAWKQQFKGKEAEATVGPVVEQNEKPVRRKRGVA